MKVNIDLSQMLLKDLIYMKKEIDKHINLKVNEHKTRINTLELSYRAYNCLKNCGILYLEDLTKISKKEFLKFRNVGKRSVEEIQDLLNTHKIDFAKNQ